MLGSFETKVKFNDASSKKAWVAPELKKTSIEEITRGGPSSTTSDAGNNHMS
jgi:hypothetical protein